MKRRTLLHTLASTAGLSLISIAPTARAQSAWATIESQAKGQTVRFNAWAGSEQINAYLQWVVTEVRSRYGVNLEHVKISDTADVVKRVRTEVSAGRAQDGGTVDLVWINGDNFAAMKREGLLFGPFADSLPHFRWVDTTGKPTTLSDFSIPTDGYEAPWGMAQFTLFADQRRLPQPPQSMADLLTLARQQAGRITYPRPPDFHGTTFIKQALLEHSPNAAVFARPYTPEAFGPATAGLWQFLDALHPHLWRKGKQFPLNAAALRQMMADGELLLALTFNPNEAANEIAAKRLAPSVMSWQFDKGTIANTHFVAIPVNARSKAGAQVVANFLLSPLAQARKADIQQWGDPTVLATDRLPADERKLFTSAPLPGQVTRTAPALPEPHASWVKPLEREWLQRYGQ